MFNVIIIGLGALVVIAIMATLVWFILSKLRSMFHVLLSLGGRGMYVDEQGNYVRPDFVAR